MSPRPTPDRRPFPLRRLGVLSMPPDYFRLLPVYPMNLLVESDSTSGSLYVNPKRSVLRHHRGSGRGEKFFLGPL